MGKLRQLLRDYIARIVIETFSKDSLKSILEKIVEYLKEQAKTTENIVDDWLVEALENIVNDEKKIDLIYNFIKRYIIPADGICCSLPASSDFNNLTIALTDIENEKTVAEDVTKCKAIGFVQWLKLVELVVPLLIDAYERFMKERR